MHSVKFILWSTASFRRHLLQKAISLPHAITLRTGSNKKAPAFHRDVVPGEKAGASFILCVDLSGLPVYCAAALEAAASLDASAPAATPPSTTSSSS